MITPLVVANWKMSIEAPEIREFVASWRATTNAAVDCVIAPPLAYLGLLSQVPGIRLAGQDCSSEASGAFTGECSATSLLALGCQFGIVGHSERRQRHCETDDIIATKAQQLEAVGLTPIICVGESSQEREAGETLPVIERQVRAAVRGLHRAPVVAYEPIWAIGTGIAAEPTDADAVQQAIASVLRSIFDNEGDGRVLYGGSVKPENTAEFMSKPGVDGLLVGGASLTPDSFMAICRNAGG
jgi:triosephosphate isomerase